MIANESLLCVVDRDGLSKRSSLPRILGELRVLFMPAKVDLTDTADWLIVIIRSEGSLLISPSHLHLRDSVPYRNNRIAGGGSCSDALAVARLRYLVVSLLLW